MKFLMNSRDFFLKLDEGALARKSSIEQLEKVRKLSKGIDIGDRVPDLKKQGANIHYYQNPIDTGIESYEDFEKHNKKFIPGWNTKHLLNPFKENVNEKKFLDFFKSKKSIYKDQIERNEKILEFLYKNIKYLRFGEFSMKPIEFNPITDIIKDSIITEWNGINLYYNINDNTYKLVIPIKYNLKIFEMIYDLIYDYFSIISFNKKGFTKYLKFKEK